jgi:hypothetical protein
MFKFMLILALGQLTLPEKITGQPSDFITVTATTESKEVMFVPLTDGLSVFPASLLSDKKSTVVVARRAGIYKILAYGCVDNKPTPPAITTLIVGDSPLPPPPQPNPPAPPNPSPNGYAEALQNIYGSDTNPNKSNELKKLIYCWSTILNSNFTNQKTNKDLFNAISATHKSCGLAQNEARTLRDQIGNHLVETLGDNPDGSIDFLKFTQAIVDTLNALKSIGV